MPLLSFDALPDTSRVWVFGSERALDDNESARLLAEVDRFLVHWQAHGHPLSCGRDWRDDRFLTIAVDQSTAGASGCSIDGLYRALRALESAFDTRLLGGGTLFHRDASGEDVEQRHVPALRREVHEYGVGVTIFCVLSGFLLYRPMRAPEAGALLRRTEAAGLGIQKGLELLEAHLFGFEGDLYGRTIEVALHHYIRPEAKFDSVEALVARMAEDAAEAKRLLAMPHAEQIAPVRSS